MSPNDRFTYKTAHMNQAQAHEADIDLGLRSYMLRVYNYMSVGLALTGAVAFAASTNDALMQAIFGSPLSFVVMLAPIGMVLFLSARMNSMKASTAQTMFWVYAAMMGLSLSYIFLVYTGASITRVFFITAGTFASMSLYGYTTKRDLSGFRSFLMMGLFGIIIASVVNMFMQSSAMHFVISVVGVLVFVGLTAYDTQQIKAIYRQADSGEVQEKKAIMGALRLYLDFVNLFIMLLSLFGNRD